MSETPSTLGRRAFLRRATSALALGTLPAWSTRFALAATPAGSSPIFWIHVQGSGGWDQALFCDPKPSVRPGLQADEAEVRQAGNIPYLGFADLGQSPEQGFFHQFYSRLLVVNGLDCGTNNHSMGELYFATGASVPEYPCWASQVAAVYGGDKPMSFISYGGYDRTGALLAPARIAEGSEGYLRRLATPALDPYGTPLIAPNSANLIRAAHLQRLARQLEKAALPDQRQALQALLDARAAEPKLAGLQLPGYDPEASPAVQSFRLALSAFQAGLTTSVGLMSGGFDTHDDNTNGQRTALKSLLTTLSRVVTLTEAAGVPAVVFASSDFGRTPHLTGSGTDHHPIGSALVLVNQPAQALVPGLPTNTVIGATTDGGAQTALQAVRVEPSSLALSDTGVVLTPGHLLRALRRAAGIDAAPQLASFPLSVEQDLALG